MSEFLSEFLSILRDVRTGALALSAIPGFVIFLIRARRAAFRKE